MEEYIGHLDLDWDIVLDQDQPIVRCRDCKYYEGHYGKCLRPVLVMAGEIYWTDEKDTEGVYCTHAEPDGFCKWGEKKCS